MYAGPELLERLAQPARERGARARAERGGSRAAAHSASALPSRTARARRSGRAAERACARTMSGSCAASRRASSATLAPPRHASRARRVQGLASEKHPGSDVISAKAIALRARRNRKPSHASRGASYAGRVKFENEFVVRRRARRPAPRVLASDATVTPALPRHARSSRTRAASARPRHACSRARHGVDRALRVQELGPTAGCASRRSATAGSGARSTATSRSRR